MFELVDRHFLKKPLLRRALTRIVAGNREENVTLLFSEYRVHTVREHGLFRAAHLAGSCSLFRDELPVLVHLAGILQDGDTFLDIGANIGVFAVSIVRFCTVYPKLRVYAFEPNPDTAQRLKAERRTIRCQSLRNRALRSQWQFAVCRWRCLQRFYHSRKRFCLFHSKWKSDLRMQTARCSDNRG